MFAFNSKFARKKCPCKNKTVQQTNIETVISIIVQSAVQWHEHTPSALASTESLIDVDDAVLELSQKQLL